MNSENLVLITGANSPLGIAISRVFLENNYDLLLTDIHDKSTLVRLLNRKLSNRIRYHKIDLSDENKLENNFKEFLSNYNKLDCIVNNAALTGDSKLEGFLEPFEKQTTQAFVSVLKVNLVAPFSITKVLYPLLVKSKNPSVINIASIYGIVGPNMNLYEGEKMRNSAAYGSSKGGLIQLTRYLSAVLAPTVRVNAVAPGGIIRKQNSRFIKRYSKFTPLKRMGDENDVASAVYFLASDKSSYITGQVLNVDGGWTIW